MACGIGYDLPQNERVTSAIGYSALRESKRGLTDG